MKIINLVIVHEQTQMSAINKNFKFQLECYKILLFLRVGVKNTLTSNIFCYLMSDKMYEVRLSDLVTAKKSRANGVRMKNLMRLDF
jgi:hypothetical protein